MEQRHPERIREVRLEERQESHGSLLEAEPAAQLEEQVSSLLKDWLDEHEWTGLSAAQMASHLTLQIWHSPSPLQRLMEWNLQATELREERVRNLFPLSFVA